MSDESDEKRGEEPFSPEPSPDEKSQRSPEAVPLEETPVQGLIDVIERHETHHAVLKRRVSAVQGVAALLLFGLIIVSTLWLRERRQRFPALSPGEYLGQIYGISENEPNEGIRLYVDRDPGRDDLLFVLLAPGWEPKYVQTVAEGEDQNNAEWLLPVTVAESKGKLKFIGQMTADGEFTGSVYDIENGKEGSWGLRRISESLSKAIAIDVVDTRLWLMLRSELRGLDAEIDKARTIVPEQRREIEKLTNFITEKSQLKTNADQKYEAEQAASRKISADFQKKHEEVDKLRKQIDLSQKLTGMGKLVALSRESLDRENRWLQSMLRSSVGDDSSELDEAVKRGERILDLRRQIEIENEKIYSLLHPADAVQEENMPAEPAELEPVE